MKVIKSKKLLIVLVVIVVLITGYKIFGGGSSNLEKQLIATLPREITQCYFRDNRACENADEVSTFHDYRYFLDEVLNIFEVEKITIERQTTDGNLKVVDCIIEMENENFKRIVYANLTCTKYDDGSWQVQSWSENAEPEMIPKFMPIEDEKDAKSYIANSHGFTNLVERDKNVDLESGKITYTYSVNDSFEYFRFYGDVSCERTLERTSYEYEELDYYYWDYSTENTTEINWDVLGTWYLEHSYTGEPPFEKSEIKLNVIAEENAGTSSYSYPCVDRNGDYTGEYSTSTGGASCYISGEDVKDAKCVISGDHTEIIITSDGIINLNKRTRVTRK